MASINNVNKQANQEEGAVAAAGGGGGEQVPQDKLTVYESFDDYWYISQFVDQSLKLTYDKFTDSDFEQANTIQLGIVTEDPDYILYSRQYSGLAFDEDVIDTFLFDIDDLPWDIKDTMDARRRLIKNWIAPSVFKEK